MFIISRFGTTYMHKISRIWFFLGLLAASAAPAAAQLAQSSADSATVLRATTRLVQVDVVVTDSSGRPLKDPLTAKDFEILEDGKLQKVSFFSWQRQERPGKAQLPSLPAHVVTNRPEFRGTAGPPIVLLLDGVNTPVENQLFVRQQMLKFVAEQFNASMRVAVFLLGNELTQLQDFTSDPALLYEALRKYRPQNAAAGRQGGTDVQPQAPTFQGANLPPQAAGQAGAAAGGSLPGLESKLARFEKETAASTAESRIAHTMDALAAVAHYLSGFPGRKVVIWFSASFPLNLSILDREDLDVFRSYADRIRNTTNLLSDSQVAIYTVDARGLVRSTIADPSQTGRDASGRMQLTVEQHMNANRKEAFERFNNDDSLVKLAQETGGRAFLHTNDLNHAILESIQDGSSFYVLGYYPGRRRWDRGFRTIKVKVLRDGVEVRHRRGYYAINPEDWRRGGATEMKAALERGSVDSTGVLFYARAVPPQGNADVRVEFLVDPHTITFESVAEDQRYCNLEFQVQAFTLDGKLVKAEVQQAEAPLKAETFARIQQMGLPMPVPIKLGPGEYRLRIGVRDNRTGLFGTAELPLTIPSTSN